MKGLCTAAPVLSHPNPARQFVVEADVSDTGANAVLLQRNPVDQKLHLCTFFSHHLSPAEKNYDVGNREFLPMVLVLQKWRQWLEGTEQPFVVWTDPKNFSYLQAAKRLNG